MRNTRLLIALILFSGLLMTSRVLAHDVKDPVCRMTVDSDTTPNQEVIGGKTFYFCSDTCQKKFDKEPGQYSKLAVELAGSKPRQFAAELMAPPEPVAGKPTSMEIAIRYANTKKLVHSFELVHDKLVHLILVSEDLKWFEHQHPTLGQDGIFRFTWTFPHPGRYFLYADFTPADGDNQIKRMELNVGKPSTAHSVEAKLRPDTIDTKVVDDLRIRLKKAPKTFQAGQSQILTYTITDLKGKPIVDMQPFLGVMGHMMAISQDGENVLHTHTLHGVATGSYQAAMLAVMQAGHPQVVTPDMVTEKGPTFSFKLTLTKPGMYKIWAQFMHGNRVVTVPFTMRVVKSEN